MYIFAQTLEKNSMFVKINKSKTNIVLDICIDANQTQLVLFASLYDNKM